MLRKRLVLPTALILMAAAAAAQEQAQPGRTVYERVAESVFLVQTEDEKGDSIGQGTAFLVDDTRLITNAHVVRTGKVFLKSAGLKIECRVDAEDELSDLAVLMVPPMGGVSRPLRLASELPRPGETVFAIGNPQGLERTISHGLYTGPRTVEGRDLLQVSASISQGSSGGPIVNAAGDVIGVATGYLTEGQNLNFAVPLAAVRALLAGDTSSAPSIENLLAVVRRLQGERKETSYSDDPGSDYQQLDRRISRVLFEALIVAGKKPESLLLLSETASVENNSIALEAAEQAVSVTKGANPQARVALARALRAKGFWLEGQDKEAVLRAAEDHAAAAVKALREPRPDEVALLADIQRDLPDRLGESYRNYKRVLELRKQSDPGNVSEDLLNLFETARKLKRHPDARSWFAELKRTGKVVSRHYASYADFLQDTGEYAAAGEAYLEAAQASGGTYEEWCSAARSFWTAKALDPALSAARQCIEQGATIENSEENIAYAHRAMSLMLVDRGVYDEAISHARQAIAMAPTDGWAFYALARGLHALNRYDEAVAAARNALRVTDGRHASMHFALGAAYFGAWSWAQAAAAYKKAAEMEPNDAGAAYNVAAALYNQKSYRESLAWWEEVLKRDPRYPDRASVLETIREIRARR